MSEDWKVGDLALIINDGLIVVRECEHPHRHTGAICPPVGTIHEVTGVAPGRILTHASGQEISCGCLALDFGERGAVAVRCVKVTPEEEDEFDKEVIELMKEKELLK